MNKRIRMKGEQGFFLVLGIVALFLFAVSLKLFLTAPNLSGEGTMPLICCVVMLITIVLSLFELRGYPRTFEKDVPILTKAKEVLTFLFPGKVGIIALYCIVYAALLNVVGFAVSTLAFLFISMLTLNSEKKVRTLLIAVITTVCIIVVFQFIFKVQLP